MSNTAYPEPHRCIAPSSSGRCPHGVGRGHKYCSEHLHREPRREASDIAQILNRNGKCACLTRRYELCRNNVLPGSNFCSRHASNGDQLHQYRQSQLQIRQLREQHQHIEQQERERRQQRRQQRERRQQRRQQDSERQQPPAQQQLSPPAQEREQETQDHERILEDNSFNESIRKKRQFAEEKLRNQIRSLSRETNFDSMQEYVDTQKQIMIYKIQLMMLGSWDRSSITEHSRVSFDCPVCCESNCHTGIQLPCNHYLHKKCFKEMLDSMSSNTNSFSFHCPLCRESIFYKTIQVNIPTQIPETGAFVVIN